MRSLNQFAMALIAKAPAYVMSASVLPDDGRIHRLAGRAIPYQGGFPLVGDTDRRHLIGSHTSLFEHRTTGALDGAPEILRIMLDPAIGRKVLSELLLSRGQTLSPSRLNRMARELVVPWSMDRMQEAMKQIPLRAGADDPVGAA